MMGMVRGLIALSKREKGLDENRGGEDGGVSMVSGGSDFENREVAEGRFKSGRGDFTSHVLGTPPR